MSQLGDFSDPPALRALVDDLTDGGRLNDRFENFAIQNISTWVLAGGFPKDTMRFYGYPADQPLYVFMVDESDPHIQVRTPSEGHNSEILEESLVHVLKLLMPAIEKHGKVLLEADIIVRAMFFKLQSEGWPFETVYYGDFFPYFMDERQKKMLLKTELTAPDGYQLGVIDIPKEHEKIHSVWPFSNTAPVQITRERLYNLPSACVRDLNGNLASWELTHAFGQLTHLFTLEPYRGSGIGLLAENLLAQITARNGLQVYKYVVDTNVSVVRGTDKHPLWSQWRSIKGGTESDENEKDIRWSFNIFNYKK
ncbi:hypothetical protein PFISCL1PPCAC_13231, partial [Pristionchus fissidentatus]